MDGLRICEFWEKNKSEQYKNSARPLIASQVNKDVRIWQWLLFPFVLIYFCLVSSLSSSVSHLFLLPWHTVGWWLLVQLTCSSLNNLVCSSLTASWPLWCPAGLRSNPVFLNPRPQPSAELKELTHSFESGVLEQGNMENMQGPGLGNTDVTKSIKIKEENERSISVSSTFIFLKSRRTLMVSFFSLKHKWEWIIFKWFASPGIHLLSLVIPLMYLRACSWGEPCFREKMTAFCRSN